MVGGGGGGAGSHAHRLSMPVDSTDWASSHESVNSSTAASPYEEEGLQYHTFRSAAGMEPQELALPELMTVYSRDFPALEISQDNSQVTT